MIINIFLILRVLLQEHTLHLENYPSPQNPLPIQFEFPKLRGFCITKKNKPPKVLPSQSPPFLPLHLSFFSKPSPPKLPNRP